VQDPQQIKLEGDYIRGTVAWTLEKRERPDMY
jgi:hypothetical protein